MYEIKDEVPVYSGPFLHVNQLEVEHNKSTVFNREIVRRPCQVALIPIVGHYMLLRGEYRPSIDKFCYELPSASEHEEEEPLHAARRELRDGLGFIANDWRFLTSCYSSLGWTDEKICFYMAKDLEGVTDFKLDRKEGRVTLDLFPIDEVVRYALNGHFFGAATNLGILMAANELDKI